MVFTVGSARRLGLLHLAGLSQVLRADASASAPAELDQSGPYALVRHPIYFGWLLIVWPAPTMTGTRLVFAIVSTLYLGLAVPFEERDLRRLFGPAYDAYARRVKWPDQCPGLSLTRAVLAVARCGACVECSGTCCRWPTSSSSTGARK